MCLQYKQQFMNTIIRTVYIRRPCKYSNNFREYLYNDVWPTQPMHIIREYCCFIISHKWLYTCVCVCVIVYVLYIHFFFIFSSKYKPIYQRVSNYEAGRVGTRWGYCSCSVIVVMACTAYRMHCSTTCTTPKTKQKTLSIESRLLARVWEPLI